MHYTIFRLNRGRNGMKGNIFSWAGSSKNGGKRYKGSPVNAHIKSYLMMYHFWW